MGFGEIDRVKRLCAPLTEVEVRQLKAGDEVVLDGIVYTARNMAHQRLCQAIDQRAELPIQLEGAILYFVGPTPARPGRVMGAAGPTTSARMDPFSPKLIAHGLAP